MKRQLTAILLAALPLWAFGNKVNLDSLYRVLDQAIDSAFIYQERKLAVIDNWEKQYLTAKTPIEHYQNALNLYKEYAAFENDSALKYVQLAIDWAEQMQRPDLKAASELALAYQLADTGFYPEAERHFNNLRRDLLDADQQLTFLSGMNHLYGEMGYYTHDERLKKEFFDKAQGLRDSLLALYPEDSRSYNALKSMILNNKNRPDEAMPYSDRWLALVQPDTRAYAIMAFYRSEIYKKKKDVEMQRYWLILSALTDVRTAINDQSALWSLANSIIREEGDLDRAYKYMDFSWNCISKFSTHMRSWLVSPILTRINDQYKAELHSTNRNLRWALAVISLLAIALLVLFVFVSKKRRQLAVARNELASSNARLSQLNGQLQETNAELHQSVLQLHDANRVKEEYITKFLGLCSGYIDKLDAYRIKINRKVKANQYADILKLTSSSQMKEEELKELVVNFDNVFLHLFPTFVDEFNALLKPDCRVTLNEDGSMTTDLRIFALIRLGLEESSRIAEFLGYSPNSIYNYRARMKNKALGDRDAFEQRVKEIGIKG